MKNKLFLIAIIAILFSACSGNQKQAEQQAAAEEETVVTEPVKMTVSEFVNGAGEVVGEQIIMEGLVNHVCQHGGKRMFLIDTVTQETVKIVTGENMASFNTDLEGQDVIVKGIVDELRIDENYLTEWEAELAEAEGEHLETGDGHGEGDKGEAADQGEHIAAQQQIDNYRKQMAEEGVDHLSFYSIVCEEYNIKDADK